MRGTWIGPKCFTFIHCLPCMAPLLFHFHIYIITGSSRYCVLRLVVEVTDCNIVLSKSSSSSLLTHEFFPFVLSYVSQSTSQLKSSVKMYQAVFSYDIFTENCAIKHFLIPSHIPVSRTYSYSPSFQCPDLCGTYATIILCISLFPVFIYVLDIWFPCSIFYFNYPDSRSYSYHHSVSFCFNIFCQPSILITF